MIFGWVRLWLTVGLGGRTEGCKSGSRAAALQSRNDDDPGTIGMVEPDGVSGVHPGFGGIFERDNRDARGDSRPRSFHAQFGRKECGGGGAIAAFEGIASARGGSRVQRFADQPGGKTDAAAGDVDESVAAGARGAEPGAEATGDSVAGGEYAAGVAN